MNKFENISVVNYGGQPGINGEAFSLRYDARWGANKGEVYLKNTGFTICKSPFHNCQIYTIASFETLLMVENVLEILSVIQKSMLKSELLVDIKNRDYNESKINTLFKKDEIIFRQPYRNNTGSQMCMYLLQIQRMLIRVEKEEKAKNQAKPLTQLIPVQPAVTQPTVVRAAASRTRTINRDSHGRFASVQS